jgi:hypothetical protein
MVPAPWNKADKQEIVPLFNKGGSKVKKIRIGGGAGFARDRIEPAVELAEKGDIDYLVFECLAERTIATDQLEKMANPAKGYNVGLERRMAAVLPICARKGIRIITNMGSANPEGAARKVSEMCGNMGIRGLKIAAVVGDDVTELVRGFQTTIFETGESLDIIRDKIVSANAYLGAEPIAEALRGGADIVIIGRSADPSLFVGPMVHEFKWAVDDWKMLGIGTVLGHLLECGGQVTGGYFADPGYKNVEGLNVLGFPICEVAENGEAVITKVSGSGGEVSLRTCKEQLLYEIHDPSRYFTPDVVADFTGVEFTQMNKDVVRIAGGTGSPRSDTYKVSVGYRDSFIGEGQMSYAGSGALDRAKLAVDIVQKRLALQGFQSEETRIDFIGLNSIHGPKIRSDVEPYEVRFRISCRTASAAEAAKVGNEVATLLTNGPAGGSGDFVSVREIIAILSVLIPRELVNPSVIFV